jgi:hypothetical protein
MRSLKIGRRGGGEVERTHNDIIPHLDPPSLLDDL